jgi:predicted dinucleotide-binding enzyme
MKIGIIGAGAIGGTLARDFVSLGHEVYVANSRGPETLAKFAAESGATAVSLAAAVQGAEVVIVSIPEAAVTRLPPSLFADAPADLVIVDTGNYYADARDGRIEGLESAATESGWVAEQLGRPVIKAFNNIGAASLASKGAPPKTPGRVALPVAGDSAAAKATVLRLVESLGFDAVDGGSLADSWRQQPGTPAYCHDLDAETLKRALADAEQARLPQYRAQSDARAKQMIAARKAAAAAKPAS